MKTNEWLKLTVLAVALIASLHGATPGEPMSDLALKADAELAMVE